MKRKNIIEQSHVYTHMYDLLLRKHGVAQVVGSIARTLRMTNSIAFLSHMRLSHDEQPEKM